ncbi:hypothetical protein [Corallococcus exercitus]|uniref:hypothetical protein n=1 Tax=Corallococcus exercitus TaxID=2316736 RepID=UPI0035D3FFA2
MTAPLELTPAGAALFLEGARLKNAGLWAVDFLDASGQVLCRVALPNLSLQEDPPALIHPVVTGDVQRTGTVHAARLRSGPTTVAPLTVGLYADTDRQLRLPTLDLVLGRRLKLSDFRLPYLHRTPAVVGTRDVYGTPASYFPATLDLPDDFTGDVHLLETPGSALPLGTVTTHVTYDERSASIPTATLPPFAAPAGMPSGLVLVSTEAAPITDEGDYIQLGPTGGAKGGLATTGAVGFDFTLTNDVPAFFGFRFRGRMPASIDDAATLGAMWMDRVPGGFTVYSDWAYNIVFRNHSDNQQLEIPYGLAASADIDVAFRYTDDPQGPGGSVQFYKDGVALGGPRTLTAKLKLQPVLPFFVNNIGWNHRNGTAGLGVRALDFTVPVPVVTQQFTALGSTVVPASVARTLMFDATALTAPSGPYPLRYRLGSPDASAGEDLAVRVGPYVTAANEAHDVVLQDWSTGAPVQVGVYTITKVVGQNLSLEDAEFGPLVGTWTEVTPLEAPIEIGGLRYYCEGIRMRGYTQLQFGYDFAPSALPSTPFGDPQGIDSYMIPHKWVVRDRAGNPLGTLQQHDGTPLNQAGRSPVFEGPWDGVNKPLTTPTNRWVPFGTARAGLIWRSKQPEPVPPQTLGTKLPRYATDVPYAMHLDYSSNGFDWRLAFGGHGPDGQVNGFGNIRVMPFHPTDAETWVNDATVGAGDPYKGLYGTNSKRAVGATWLKYTPFNMQARSPVTGPGGIRDDRQAIAEPVWLYLTNPSGQRWDGTSYLELALDYLTGYVSDPIHVFEDGRPRPLFRGRPTRPITMRGHWYGWGEASTPPERAYYAKGGRPYELCDDANPWRAKVPVHGSAPGKPVFGTYQIDSSHAHQYPHWGSLLFRTPEFAFLGHKFWDQTRLYSNRILPGWGELGERSSAWAYLHAALAWKTAAKRSERLYSREDVLAFVQLQLEDFHDTWCATTPGLFNPPETFTSEFQLFAILVNRFGPGYMSNGEYQQHDFFIGYWLHALAIGERLGFNAALRARSARLTAVLDWMVELHRKRIVGRLVDGPRLTISGNSYLFTLPASVVANAGGVAANLPQGYADLIPHLGQADTWAYNGPGTQGGTRDGQGLDLLMAGPSQLKYGLGLTGAALDTAEAAAAAWRNDRKAAEEAKGSDAGSGWFRYLQGSHNPMLPAAQGLDVDQEVLTDLSFTGIELSALADVEDV